MIGLKEFILEASIEKKIITYTQNDVNPHSNSVSLKSECEKCDTVIIKDINLSNWVFYAETFKNIKHIIFENCSGSLVLAINKMRGLEYIDFSDCKNKLTIVGHSYIKGCPKLKMEASDWMVNHEPDSYGNNGVQVSKCPLLNDKCFPITWDNCVYIK